MRQSQQVFRAFMNATARPATAVPLSGGISAPAPLD
ncbi:MAG: phosphonate C-P lyase system protein PhnH, partial [Sphingomonadales bacterium]|nr:phosphonate C-P lyase system protein PhnH [Sphingomonadales bacterium]